MDELLKLLKQNARFTVEELAAMLDKTPQQIQQAINDYQKQGIIKGYQAIINTEKLPNAPVFALIECKVIPKKETGFQEIADKVMEFAEVDSVYLMAGNYDLAVFVQGRSIQEIASFVATRLSTLESVTATATRFVLTKYKQDGILMQSESPVDYRFQEVR